MLVLQAALLHLAAAFGPVQFAGTASRCLQKEKDPRAERVRLNAQQRRKRRKTATTTLNEPAGNSAVSDIEGEEDVTKLPEIVKGGTQYDPSLTQFFTDDWSGMQPPPNMKPPKSKLSPLTGTGPDQAQLSAAERFNEGDLVRWSKTATWFAIVALVVWEIYIHTPLFHPAGAPTP